MGKLASYPKSWKGANPGGSDILEELAGMLRSEARWEKAVQHLKDKGLLEESPRDIGALLKEVSIDVLAECEEMIKDKLFKWAWKKKLSMAITTGLPEWYKERLARTQFGYAEQEEACSGPT